jgi:hypothetical protein
VLRLRIDAVQGQRNLLLHFPTLGIAFGIRIVGEQDHQQRRNSLTMADYNAYLGNGWRRLRWPRSRQFSAAWTSRSTSGCMVLVVCVAAVWTGGRKTTSRAINVIDMNALLEGRPSPGGFGFEDNPKARTGRLSEALQRIG